MKVELKRERKMKSKHQIKEIKHMYQDVGYHKKFITLFVIIVVAAILEIITVPIIVKQILEIQIPQKNLQALVILTIIYIGQIVIQGYMVLKHCEMRCFLSRIVKRDLRNRIFEKLQKVKVQFFEENETGMILQFLQDDTQNAGELFPITITEMFIMGGVRFSIIVVFLLLVDLKITIIVLILYMIGLFSTLFFNRKTMKKLAEIRTINKDVYTSIHEGIQNYLTIKTLGIINEKIEDLGNKLKDYNYLNSKLEKIISTYHTIFSFIISISTVSIVYFGGMKVIQAMMTYGEMMLMIKYADYLEFEFSWITRHFTDFNQCFLAYSKILELLEKQEEENLDKGEELVDKITHIEFDKVSFSYDSTRKNIEKFSLSIAENEKIALIGRTGVGKTTIVNLLERLYEPQKGEIRINHRDYKQYSISSIRNKIGYIMQEVQIVPNTIIDNIKYVNENITKEEIIEIFKILNLHEKIKSLPKGYDTDIYEDSNVLSIGEKQMISFARIMAMSPDVIILDEVTSNLSWQNEELIKNAMNTVMQDRITLIIAHRLSTIESCNKIVTLT